MMDALSTDGESREAPWPGGRPFSLRDECAYESWRAWKLANYPSSPDDLMVEISDFDALTIDERAAIQSLMQRANMATYALRSPSTDEGETRRRLIAFGHTFGMRAIEDHRSAESDGIVRIEVVDRGGRLGYIPYTDKPINWHTDGYYNFHPQSFLVRAMLLHCARPACDGGINRLLDPDIAYIRLRDIDPSFIEALMQSDAMTIPANIEADGRVRPDNVGPVFFVDGVAGALGMRFTARKRNVVWRNDALTRRAVEALMATLEADPLVMTVRLGAGQGLICNNVLHDRTAFSGGRRLLYRIRYANRVGDSPPSA